MKTQGCFSGVSIQFPSISLPIMRCVVFRNSFSAFQRLCQVGFCHPSGCGPPKSKDATARAAHGGLSSRIFIDLDLRGALRVPRRALPRADLEGHQQCAPAATAAGSLGPLLVALLKAAPRPAARAPRLEIGSLAALGIPQKAARGQWLAAASSAQRA